MNHRRLRLTTCAVMAVVTGTLVAQEPNLTTYAAMQDTLRAWEEEGVVIDRSQISQQGREIPLVRFGDGPVRILYLNALHANEPSGTEAFIRLGWALLGELAPSYADAVLPGLRDGAPALDLLADSELRKELLARITILGFPILDPDGVANGRTRNSLSNADYLTGLTSITQSIRYAVETYQPDLMLDSHGGPDAPDLNIGLVEPLGIESATRARSRELGAQSWRIAAAHDIQVSYFEEHPLAFSLGLHSEPFRSVDAAYYATLARGVPLTQESHQLRGIPMLYTETVGLQSGAPSIGLSEGASGQQVIMAGLALDAAGLLDGTMPKALEAPASAGAQPLQIDRDGTHLYARVSWNSFGPDFTLRLLREDGSEVIRGDASDTVEPLWVQGRALRVDDLPAGHYSLQAEAWRGSADAVIRATWWSPDDSAPLPAVLDRQAEVHLCLTQDNLFSQLVRSLPPTAFLAAPVCSEATESAPRHAEVMQRPRGGSWGDVIWLALGMLGLWRSVDGRLRS